MNYFLDTNIIIYFLNDNQNFQVGKNFEKINSSQILIPSIVEAELLYGAQKSKKREFTLNKLEEFLINFRKVPFDSDAAVYYAIIRFLLESKGKLIGTNDLLIAATVLANDGILVTNNVKEFSRVPNLKIENWLE